MKSASSLTIDWFDLMIDLFDRLQDADVLRRARAAGAAGGPDDRHAADAGGDDGRGTHRRCACAAPRRRVRRQAAREGRCGD